MHGTFEYLFVFHNFITTNFKDEQGQHVPVTRA